jgi:hypothetical protein
MDLIDLNGKSILYPLHLTIMALGREHLKTETSTDSEILAQTLKLIAYPVIRGYFGFPSCLELLKCLL